MAIAISLFAVFVALLVVFLAKSRAAQKRGRDDAGAGTTTYLASGSGDGGPRSKGQDPDLDGRGDSDGGSSGGDGGGD